MFKEVELGEASGTLKYTIDLQGGHKIDADEYIDIVAFIVGPTYYDCEDALDRWNMRLKAARSLSMQMLQYDKEVIVKSEDIHIKDNYGTDLKDSDYKMDHPVDHEIDITNEEAFLTSLGKMEFIKIVKN